MLNPSPSVGPLHRFVQLDVDKSHSLGHAADDQQISLIQQAKKDGVKRFVPSEFGVGPQSLPFPFFDGKRKIAKIVQEASFPDGTNPCVLIVTCFSVHRSVKESTNKHLHRLDRFCMWLLRMGHSICRSGGFGVSYHHCWWEWPENLPFHIAIRCRACSGRDVQKPCQVQRFLDTVGKQLAFTRRYSRSHPAAVTR